MKTYNQKPNLPIVLLLMLAWMFTGCSSMFHPVDYSRRANDTWTKLSPDSVLPGQDVVYAYGHPVMVSSGPDHLLSITGEKYKGYLKITIIVHEIAERLNVHSKDLHLYGYTKEGSPVEMIPMTQAEVQKRNDMVMTLSAMGGGGGNYGRSTVLKDAYGNTVARTYTQDNYQQQRIAQDRLDRTAEWYASRTADLKINYLTDMTGYPGGQVMGYMYAPVDYFSFWKVRVTVQIGETLHEFWFKPIE